MARGSRGWIGSGIRLARFGSCSSGATAIEYGLIAAIMAVAVITSFRLFGSSIHGMYETIGTLIVTKIE